MNISDLARSGATLVKLTGFLHAETQSEFVAILFSFENKPALLLVVDPDTDSMSWQNTEPTGLEKIAIENIYPKVQIAYGLQLAWVWEMNNQQGYFDAFQMELVDASLKNEQTFQFKASASRIELFEVLKSSS